MAYQNVKDAVRSIPKFGGDTWFVSKTKGDNANDGKTPSTAFETIGAGITASASGDMITVMAGTYTETGITIGEAGVKDYLEVHFEIGAILDPASGIPLTIAGNYCWVGCHNGALKINNNSAAVTAVVITGSFAYLNEIRVDCNSVGTIGFDIQGNGADLRECRCANPLTAAFKIQGDRVRIMDCCTGGTPTDTSIGFWMTNSCDKFRIKRCGSQGHGTAGYQVDTDCTNGVIEEFYSGGGDGALTDTDNATVISRLSYPETKYATQTFAGGGGGSTNLFKVVGSVEIIKIYGHVTEALNANVDNLNLEFDDGGASVDITTAVDVSSAPVGSFFLKNDEATEPLIYASSANAAIIEAPTGFKSQQVISPFMLVAKAGADNYITADYSGVATDGVIHWHVEWKPLTDDGFVSVA